ncbi:MAG: hypothetical protein BGO33_14450 [Bacteroidia bacterium 43-41]|nr:MAG: hypothetical protein BGO33_14450 [Bacteroidia bacterium 43-41]
MQKLLLILITALLPTAIWGQNSIMLSIPEADNIFLSQNLTLLAQKYNIDKAEAMLIQAGLFENPTLSFEQIAYNSDTRQYFNTGSQHAIELEQVINISGKRAKQKEIEWYNIEIARHEFESVLRELKYSLHACLIGASYTQKSISIFDKEIEHLNRLVKVYTIQYEKGNVSLIEKSRLEALLFALKTEQLEYIGKLNEFQKQLRLLMNLKPDVTVSPKLDNSDINISMLDMGRFQDYINNNPQLKIAELQIKQEEANLSLQKRLRVPDIVLKGIYDKSGGITPNYVGMGLSVGLPIFNRNQGNIKAATAQIAQNKLNYENTANEIQAELSSKFSHLKLLYDFYSSIDKSLEKDFTNLIEGVSSSFEKRNINMLEFIDYYETYKETCLKLYEHENTLLTGIEEINKLIGSDYIKLWSK